MIHKIIYVTFLSIYGNFSCNSNGRRNIKFLYCLAMKIALNNKSFLTCVCLDKKTTLMENTLGYMQLYQIIQYNRNIKLLELHNYYGAIVIFFFQFAIWYVLLEIQVADTTLFSFLQTVQKRVNFLQLQCRHYCPTNKEWLEFQLIFIL